MLLQQAVQEVYALKDVKIHTKTSKPESLFPSACSCIKKETPTQVFSCEFS